MLRGRRLAGPLTSVTAICLLLTSCSMTEPSLPGFRVEITEPDAGRIIAVGTRTTVAFFVESEELVTDATLYANGETVATLGALRTLSSGLYGGSFNWTPTPPGEYLLKVVAGRATGRDAISAGVRVCVMHAPMAAAAGFLNYGYEGDCDLPPVNELAIPEQGLDWTLYVGPNPLQYNVLPDTAIALVCPAVPNPRVTVQVDMTDASDRIVLVSAILTAPGTASGSGADLTAGLVSSLVLTQQPAEFPRKLWRGTTFGLDDTLQGLCGSECTHIDYEVRLITRDGRYESWEEGRLPIVNSCPGAPATPTQSAAAAEQPAPTQPSARCEAFEGMDFSFVTLARQAGQPLTTYVKMPGGVPGLETPIEGDDETVSYAARWGDYVSTGCEFIAGYKERLYCDFNIPSQASSLVMPFELSVSGCEAPVYRNARAEVPGYATGASGGTGGEADGCALTEAMCSGQGLVLDSINCQCIVFQ